MRTLVMLVVLGVAACVFGCHPTSEEGKTQAALLRATGDNGIMEENVTRHRRIDAINNLNRRMMIDDWDALCGYERSSSLSYYLTYVGMRH